MGKHRSQGPPERGHMGSLDRAGQAASSLSTWLRSVPPHQPGTGQDSKPSACAGLVHPGARNRGLQQEARRSCRTPALGSLSGKDTVSSRALAITRFSIICRCRDSVCQAMNVGDTCSKSQHRSHRTQLPTHQRGFLHGLAGVEPCHPCLIGSFQLLVLQRCLLQWCQLPAGNEVNTAVALHASQGSWPAGTLPG